MNRCGAGRVNAEPWLPMRIYTSSTYWSRSHRLSCPPADCDTLSLEENIALLLFSIDEVKLDVLPTPRLAFWLLRYRELRALGLELYLPRWAATPARIALCSMVGIGRDEPLSYTSTRDVRVTTSAALGDSLNISQNEAAHTDWA